MVYKFIGVGIPSHTVKQNMKQKNAIFAKEGFRKVALFALGKFSIKCVGTM